MFRVEIWRVCLVGGPGTGRVDPAVNDASPIFATNPPASSGTRMVVVLHRSCTHGEWVGSRDLPEATVQPIPRARAAVVLPTRKRWAGVMEQSGSLLHQWGRRALDVTSATSIPRVGPFLVWVARAGVKLRCWCWWENAAKHDMDQL